MKIFLIITMFLSSLFGWVAQISALKGDVKIIKNDKTEVKATLETKLDKTDIIKTDKNGKLQLIFKDNTVITIGRNSEVKIENYIFEDKNPTATFRLKHGIMKTLTGKIGKIAPKRFKVLTKNASIGIRGTYFVVETSKYDIKLGMIMGVTTFTNLDTQKEYIVKAGEQLIFNFKHPEQIKIKKDFIEPKEVKNVSLSNIKNSQMENIVKDIRERVDTNEKDPAIQQNSKSNKFYDGFIRGLFE